MPVPVRALVLASPAIAVGDREAARGAASLTPLPHRSLTDGKGRGSGRLHCPFRRQARAARAEPASPPPSRASSLIGHASTTESSNLWVTYSRSRAARGSPNRPISSCGAARLRRGCLRAGSNHPSCGLEATSSECHRNPELQGNLRTGIRQTGTTSATARFLLSLVLQSRCLVSLFLISPPDCVEEGLRTPHSLAFRQPLHPDLCATAILSESRGFSPASSAGHRISAHGRQPLQQSQSFRRAGEAYWPLRQSTRERWILGRFGHGPLPAVGNDTARRNDCQQSASHVTDATPGRAERLQGRLFLRTA